VLWTPTQSTTEAVQLLEDHLFPSSMTQMALSRGTCVLSLWMVWIVHFSLFRLGYWLGRSFVTFCQCVLLCFVSSGLQHAHAAVKHATFDLLCRMFRRFAFLSRKISARGTI
jgi:hypothetical protein